MGKHENITPEYECLRATVEGLRDEVEKYKLSYLETQNNCNAKLKNLTTEYEDRISLIQKEHQEKVQELTEQIESMEYHISQLITDNTIMSEQLNIVKMIFGVHE